MHLAAWNVGPMFCAKAERYHGRVDNNQPNNEPDTRMPSTLALVPGGELAHEHALKG
jgi:hypothetical protein